MDKVSHVLLLFVDGLGVPAGPSAYNLLRDDVCPALVRLMSVHSRPIDACLGVDGIPQSATGQTSLLTGVNAAREVGRHVEGFPGPQLRAIIREHNIFKQLADRGLSGTFANGYFRETLSEVSTQRIQSVTTVASLSGLGSVRLRDAIECDEAVCHDLTRASLVERGYEGRLIEPSEAAAHLVRIATGPALTLFEHFRTDRAGHRCEVDLAVDVLSVYDRFLSRVLELAGPADVTVVLTSDHGNIEDMSTSLHTRNPVPFAAVGPGADELLSRVSSLVDVPSALISALLNG